jgi:hypothetical protein
MSARIDTTLPTVNARIYPRGGLDVLSRDEVARLRDASTGMHDLLRRCALAVLTSGSASDDPRAARELYPDFDIQVHQQDRGVRIDLAHAPAMAFVDGEIIHGVADLLFAVVRDLAYTAIELRADSGRDLESTDGITDAVFGLLRNARILHPTEPNLVVCWGGHSISRDEYVYTKQVGYELGLRGLDICTGCGPGAMKGPMKGATIAHAKQRQRRSRYIGITEPGIIAAESPNPIVNHLVIMPDIEKRLEAFVRLGHGIIVFPGGRRHGRGDPLPAGHPAARGERGIAVPADLHRAVRIGAVLRADRQIPAADARRGGHLTLRNRDRRPDCRGQAHGGRHPQGAREPIAHKDSFFFNWSLKVPVEFQRPFVPSHEAMAKLDLHHGRKPHELAADLRRAFSGIVAGNVKEDGMRRIEAHGPFEIHGDPGMMQSLDALLRAFVEQRRMKIAGEYRPCYRVLA